MSENDEDSILPTHIVTRYGVRTGYAIQRIPNRKSVALCRIRGAHETPIAYFAEDEEAQDFARWLGDMFARSQ